MTENAIPSLQWWARNLTFLFLQCDWALLSQSWTLGMVSERDRLPVCWCSSAQTLFGSSFFEDGIINANHIGIRPFGSFNYIYLIFIPHCNSTQPFRGTAESMKPDVVFNLLTSLWKTDSSHCGNVLKTNCSHFSSPPPPRITKCQGIILCFAWIIFGYKRYLAIVPLLKLYL